MTDNSTLLQYFNDCLQSPVIEAFSRRELTVIRGALDGRFSRLYNVNVLTRFPFEVPKLEMHLDV